MKVTYPNEIEALPLETKFSALRFQQSNGQPPEEIDGPPAPILIFNSSGEVEERYSDHVDWQNVLGFRAPDCSHHFGECQDCGSVTRLFYRGEMGNDGKPITIVSEICAPCEEAGFDDWLEAAE